MGLKPFEGMEIRSVVMGIPVTITKRAIFKACRVSSKGFFKWDVSPDDVLLQSYVNLFSKGNPKTKTAEMEVCHRLLLKFSANCFFQRGGGADQPNKDHQLALYSMATFQRIDLPKYFLHHLCWAIKEGISKERKQVPCGRLLSEIFHQGKLLETLRSYKQASDRCFTVTTSDRILNNKSLYAMKVISKLPIDEKWIDLTTAESEPLKNFPSILQENNPEVLASLVAAHARESGVNIVAVAAAPDVSKGKRARTSSESDAAGTKKQKVGAASIPMKRSKEAKTEESKPKKKEKQASGPIFTPMVEVTSDMKKEANEQAVQMLAEQKRNEAQ